MHSEAEIRRKLRKIETRKERAPSFWNILIGDVYQECFEYVLADKRRAFWKQYPRLPRRKKGSQK